MIDHKLFVVDNMSRSVMPDDSFRYKRRSLLKSISVGAIAATAGCIGGGGNGSAGNSSGGGSNVTFTIASTFEPENILVRTAQDFKEKIESESDGAVEVTISAGGAYGGEGEIGEIVSQGGVEAHVAGSFPYYQYAPSYWFFGSPFVISTYDQILSILQSDRMQEAHETLKQDGNQRPIGQQIYRGQRNFTANKPVRTPEAVQGMNLRLPELDPWVTIWRQVGASPTPVALDELYSALEQGVVDASEGGVTQITSYNLSEVQSHLSLTQHLPSNGNIYMNEQFFQGLDQTYRDMILELGREATQEASQRMREREEEFINELQSGEMTVVEDVNHDAFRSAAEPAITELFESTWAFDWEIVRNM